MEWHKLIQRPLTDEEKEESGGIYDVMWEGVSPDIDEEVLVSYGENSDTFIDTWTEFDDGTGFEYADAEIIYWMQIPRFKGN